MMASRGGPRPPSILERHYFNASPVQPSFPPSMMPSFQPGQIVNAGFYGNGGPPMAQAAGYEAGGWDVARQYAQQPQYQNLQPMPVHNQQYGLERAPSASSAYSENGMTQSYRPELHRQYSGASSAQGHVVYSGGDVHRQPTQNMGYPPQPQSWGHGNERPLSEIQEGAEERVYDRSGTPEQPNPQFYFRTHVQSPSNGTTRSTSQPQLAEIDRRLSVRNNDGI